MHHAADRRRPKRREPLLTPPFVLLASAHFLHGLALNLYVHVPGFLKQLGANELEIGGMFAATGGVAILFRPSVGTLMDRQGRRVVILGGGVLHVVVCLLYLTIATRGVWVAAVRALHGLAEAALFTSLFTLAADLVPAARRTEGIALFGISGLLPIACAGVLGDVVLAHTGYHDLFRLSALLALIALLISLPVRDVAQHDVAHGRTARRFWRTLLEPALRPLWFVGIVFALCLAAVFVFIKTYLLTLAVGTVGEFLTAYIVAAVFLRLFFGWVPDRVGPKRALVPAIFALSAGCFVLAFARTRLALAVAGVLTGLGHGFTFPIVGGMVVTRARPSERGSAISLFTAAFDLGLLVGGPTFGAIVARAGYPVMYVVAGSICLFGAITYAAWER